MNISTPQLLQLESLRSSESPRSHRDKKSVAAFKFKESSKEEEPRDPLFMNPSVPQPSLPGVSTSSSAVQTPPPVLPIALDALFETMASQMVIMTSSHEQTTTLVLDSDRFASSPLAGAKITITEFRTAPQIFNVEISGAPSAVALIQQSQEALLRRIATGHFSFSIHRFEAVSAPRFHPTEERKQKEEQDDEGHTS